ncbi:MAG: hypothetical protein LQ340_007128, partial [Diploschistes diacapsis]
TGRYSESAGMRRPPVLALKLLATPPIMMARTRMLSGRSSRRSTRERERWAALAGE